jgi:hypothetical protein
MKPPAAGFIFCQTHRAFGNNINITTIPLSSVIGRNIWVLLIRKFIITPRKAYPGFFGVQAPSADFRTS